MDEIIKDIEKKLNIKIENIKKFEDGKTDSIVFSINNKYLVKTVDDLTLKSQIEFLKQYNDYFQKVVYYNEKLSYICFEFIEGVPFKEAHINSKEIINQIYNIVKTYKKYDYQGFGYLYEDHKTWYEFLKDEINYSKEIIKEEKLPDIIEESLEKVKNYKIDKYLIHGDFGTHNFIIEGKKLRVIDPMPIVGDYLYDFYFAIFSNVKIFENIDLNYILNFFNRKEEYKKAIFTLTLYIRMCRCYKYDKENYSKYKEVFESITKLKKLSLEKNIEPLKQKGPTCAIMCLLMILKYYNVIPKVNWYDEKKYYKRYKSLYMEGVPFSKIALNLASNNLKTKLIHSEDNFFSNNRNWLGSTLFEKTLDEYKTYAKKAYKNGAEIKTKTNIDEELIKDALKNNYLIIMAGVTENILHSVLIVEYKNNHFIVCDPLYKDKQYWNLKKLTKYMETPIGKWCILVKENK